MQEVVSGERDQLMIDLAEKLQNVVLAELGVELVDVRVKQIDLPKDVSESVYRRMNAEREKEAREHRAQGQELAEGIRAAADPRRIPTRYELNCLVTKWKPFMRLIR